MVLHVTHVLKCSERQRNLGSRGGLMVLCSRGGSFGVCVQSPTLGIDVGGRGAIRTNNI